MVRDKHVVVSSSGVSSVTKVVVYGMESFLAESQSRLYPHVRAKFGRDPMAVSKKKCLLTL